MAEFLTLCSDGFHNILAMVIPLPWFAVLLPAAPSIK
jgi:hypothetical protein